MIDIFNYYNYRDFIRDILEQRREEGNVLSHRFLSGKLGISSTGFMANVISGKKNLNNAHIHKLGRILKLSKSEAKYFEALVYFTQAKSQEEKTEYFMRMSSCRNVDAKLVEETKLRIFSNWYNVAIRELLYFHKFKGDFKELGRMLDPPIRPADAEKAIRDLEALDFIHKDRSGTYRQRESTLSTGDVAQSVYLTNFHLAMLQLSRDALNYFKGSERDISAMTLSLSKEGFLKAKKEAQLYRKMLAKIAKEDDNADRVYQMNLQFFPLTKQK